MIRRMDWSKTAPIASKIILTINKVGSNFSDSKKLLIALSLLSLGAEVSFCPFLLSPPSLLCV